MEWSTGWARSSGSGSPSWWWWPWGCGCGAARSSPQPRTFIWDRPLGLVVAAAEVQLWREDQLLARAEWPDATRGTLSQELTLGPGPVHVRSFVRLGDGSHRQGEQLLPLGNEAVVHAPLLPEGHR